MTFVLSKRAFAYYNVQIKDWHVESGTFEIMIGKSSRDIVLTQTVTVESTVRLPMVYTTDSIMEDIFKNPEAKAMVMEAMADSVNFAPEEGEEGSSEAEAISVEMQEAMMRSMPLRGAVGFGSVATGITMADVEALVEKLNALERA